MTDNRELPGDSQFIRSTVRHYADSFCSAASECMPLCAQSVHDGADIVRDAGMALLRDRGHCRKHLPRTSFDAALAWMEAIGASVATTKYYGPASPIALKLDQSCTLVDHAQLPGCAVRPICGAEKRNFRSL